MRLKNNEFKGIISENGLITSLLDFRDGFRAQLVRPSCGLGSISYTLKTDDITKGKKPRFSPYNDRMADYDLVSVQKNGIVAANSKLDVKTSYTLNEDTLIIESSTKNESISQFGINLPFNFMGSIDGGDYENQVLPLAPYASMDNEHIFYYFSKPDGNNFVIIVENEIDGWKLDYSPYVWGHYITNIKFLSSFDRAFKEDLKSEKRIKLHIAMVDSLEMALERFAKIKKAPIAFCPISGGAVNDFYSVKIFGKCDSILIQDELGERRIMTDGNDVRVLIRTEGLSYITPFCGQTKGANACFYGYDSFAELYKKSCLAVSKDDLDRTDGNLCEHQCWASAAMRYMRFFGRSEQLSVPVEELLSVITEDNEALAIPRRTLCSYPQNGFGQYNMYKSGRIQEAFFGVGILLDAFRLYNNERYLNYAVNSLQSLMEQYLQASGEIRRRFLDDGTPFDEDYTTVTCMIIPVIDVYLELKRLDDFRAAFFLECARKIADFVFVRGFSFPTEGGVTDLAQVQMEEGSISCSALTLLYYCYYIEQKEEYLKAAEAFLRLHDAYLMRSPDCRQNGSTLRWWETIWEGDMDGPALCCGHAWTIWRAEADFLLALIRKDGERLINSYNSFMSNLSKIDKEGRSYAIFNADYITGGGLAEVSEQVDFSLKRGFPKLSDSGLSRYVFSRMTDTWCRLSAVVNSGESTIVLNGKIVDNELLGQALSLQVLFVEGYCGTLRLRTDGREIEVITKQSYKKTASDGYLVLEFYKI